MASETIFVHGRRWIYRGIFDIRVETGQMSKELAVDHKRWVLEHFSSHHWAHREISSQIKRVVPCEEQKLSKMEYEQRRVINTIF